jgi:hypothetical protein
MDPAARFKSRRFANSNLTNVIFVVGGDIPLYLRPELAKAFGAADTRWLNMHSYIGVSAKESNANVFETCCTTLMRHAPKVAKKLSPVLPTSKGISPR